MERQPVLALGTAPPLPGVPGDLPLLYRARTAEESYDALREAGVPHRRVHHESFEF
ncbi:hypothetical protein OOK27_16240 [Streptomyces canus]|uniref:hypothetical protein n=1 Tax=Streptomyces canus TaxID=58343 RepID=UPI00224FA3CD|nr:hypothetical protein [Streptomyces canus]